MTLALDGSAHGNVGSGTSVSVNLTTSNANDVIFVVITSNNGTVSSVSDTAGLTWTQRATTNLSGTQFLFIYRAVSAGALSADSITVTMAGTTFITVDAFGVSGADTVTIFDSNASLPATSSTLNVTVSTSNANDFLICASTLGQATTGGTTPAGFTSISDANFQYVGYQVVAATQSSLVESVGHGAATYGDAVIQSSGGGGGGGGGGTGDTLGMQIFRPNQRPWR